MADQNQDNDDRMIEIDPISGDPINQYQTGQKPTSQPGQASVNPQYTPSGNQNTSFRRPNPLGNLSSYTYQVSLYMMTPECVNQYSQNGTLLRDGYFIVAQSGGLSSSDPRLVTVGPDIGPGAAGLDYFIDDLSLTTTMAGKQDGQTATITSEITFKIIEPHGFKLLNNLADAVKKLEKRSPLIQTYATAKPNLYQQNYMIAVRFYGYDVDGYPIQTKDTNSNLSVLGDNYALYERLFPIIVSGVKFKIGSGGATTYMWDANLLPLRAAFQGKINTIVSDISFRGTTVGDALGNVANPSKETLVGALRSIQDDLVAKKMATNPNQYEIQILDPAIANAKLLLTSEVIPETTTNSAAKRTGEVTVKTALQSNTIDTKTRYVTPKAGSKIVNVIDQLIASSTYVSDALSVVNQSSEEKESDPNMVSKVLKWYAIHPVVQILGRDPKLKDWVYKVTYQIAPYSVPYIRSPIVPRKQVYYGPVKQYDYLFTGQNTEILSFEQEYNNLYYILSTTTVDDDPSNQSTASGSQAPILPQASSDGSAAGTQVRGGGEKNTATKTSLNDRSSQANATIRILGDPDLLMDSPGYRLNSRELNSLATKGLAISPYAGQVFIEIVFRTAEDYSDITGLMDNATNGPVYFYSPADHKRLGTQGIIYQLIDFTSTFSKGKFEQTLNLVVVDPSVLVSARQGVQNSQNQSQPGGRELTPSSTTGTNSAGTGTNTRIGGQTSGAEGGGDELGGAPTEVRTPDFNPNYQLYPVPPNSTNDQPPSGTYNSRAQLGDMRSPISIPTSTGSTADDEANAGQASPYSLSGSRFSRDFGREDAQQPDIGADQGRLSNTEGGDTGP